MTPFAVHVSEVFSTLVAQHRFVPERAGRGPTITSLIRKETDDVFWRVFLIDRRRTGGNLDVHLRVAPPDGGAFEGENVGIHLRIAGQYEIDDAFFAACQSRIIELLPILPSFTPIVERELAQFLFPRKRWAIYKMERRVLALVFSLAENGNEVAMAAVKHAEKSAYSKGAKRLNESCELLAEFLLSKQLLDEESRVFYSQKEELAQSRLSRKLVTHLYLWGLGKASEGPKLD